MMKLVYLSLAVAGAAVTINAGSDVRSSQSLASTLQPAMVETHAAFVPLRLDVLQRRSFDKDEPSEELHARGPAEFFERAARILGLPEGSTAEDVMAHVESNPHVLHRKDGFESWERSYLRKRPQKREASKLRWSAIKSNDDHLLAYSLTGKLRRAAQKEEKLEIAKLTPQEVEARRQAKLEAKQREAAEKYQQRLETKRLQRIEDSATRSESKREADAQARKAAAQVAAQAALQTMSKAATTTSVSGKQASLPFGNADWLTRWNNIKSTSSAASSSKLPTELPAQRFVSDPQASTAPTIDSEPATVSEKNTHARPSSNALDGDAQPPPKKTKFRLFGTEFEAR